MGLCKNLTYFGKQYTCRLQNRLSNQTTTTVSVWQAIVKTRDVGDAGTDSDIRIIVYGTEDSTGWINLQGSFERDDTDTTTFRASIGEPYKIHLDHDGSGIASGWKLNWVWFCDTPLAFQIIIDWVLFYLGFLMITKPI